MRFESDKNSFNKLKDILRKFSQQHIQKFVVF